MRYVNFLLGFVFLIQGCNKNDDRGYKKVTPPTRISIFKGENQYGFPGLPLADSIVIRVSAEKPENLFNYSYYFESGGNSAYMVSSKSYIINSDLYISVSWILTNEIPSQKVTLYLTENCHNETLGNNCNIIDSLSLKAFVKTPWKIVYPGSNGDLYDIHFQDENNGIAVGDLSFNTGYLKTQDGGETWTNVNSHRNDMYQLSFCDKDTGLVVVTNNYAYYTNDGGKNFFEGPWTVPIEGHLSSADYFMVSPKTILTVGLNGTIAKTADGGKTWKTYHGFSFINRLSAITCPDNEVCFACGEIAKIIKTTDTGDTWQEQDVELNNDLYVIYFIDRNFGFAAGDYSVMIRTTNGGLTWEKINTNLTSPIIQIYFNGKDVGYIVSKSGEIIKTNDGGKTWSLINKSNYGVHDLRKAYFTGNSIFGLQSGSIFKYDLSQPK